MPWYEDHRHGSAKWATQQDIADAGLYGRSGIFLGLCPYTGHPLTSPGDAPATLIGGSGSGKGSSILAYNNFYGGSMLRLEPKAEGSAMTAHHQKEMGKDYWCFNPCGLHTGPPWNLPQHSINVFEGLKKNSPHLVSDCMRMAAMINPKNNAEGFFWVKARERYSNLLHAYVLANDQPTLPDFADMLRMIKSDFPAFERLAKAWQGFGVSEINATCAEMIETRKTSPKEYSGVMSTISGNMTFMADPRLQTLFSGADVSVSCLKGERPAVVDIAFPAENLAIWNKALRLIIGAFILEQQRSPGGAKPLFQLDEMAQLGHFEEVEQLYTYGRSFVRGLGVVQDIGQIAAHYGPQAPQTFLGSSGVIIVIGVRDFDTARLVSSMLGTQTIDVRNPIYEARAHHSRRAAFQALMQGRIDPMQAGLEIAHWNRETQHRDKFARPLMDPAEVLDMPEDMALVFVATKKGRLVIPARRRNYYENPDLPAGAFKDNPYHV